MGSETAFETKLLSLYQNSKNAQEELKKDLEIKKSEREYMLKKRMERVSLKILLNFR